MMSNRVISFEITLVCTSADVIEWGPFVNSWPRMRLQFKWSSDDSHKCGWYHYALAHLDGLFPISCGSVLSFFSTPSGLGPRFVISSRPSEDPAKHPHLRGSNLPLVGHLHRPAFAPIRQSRSDYGLVYIRFEPEENLPVIQYAGQFSPAWPCSLHAKVHVSVNGAIFIYHWSQVFEIVNILQFFSIQFDWQRIFPLLTDVLFLPHWSSDHCLLRPSAMTPAYFGYMYL